MKSRHDEIRRKYGENHLALHFRWQELAWPSWPRPAPGGLCCRVWAAPGAASRKTRPASVSASAGLPGTCLLVKCCRPFPPCGLVCPTVG